MNEAKKLSRRSFLGDLACRTGAIASATIISRAGQAQSVNVPNNLRMGSPVKAVLGQGNFQYIGAFRLPTESGGIGTGWGHGLTHRYVSGRLRFFSTCSRASGTPTSQVYEVVYPGYATSNYPLATISRHWGDVYQGHRWDDISNKADDGIVHGLFWDSVDQRLYWSYGNEYNAAYPNNCCIGYSTLNDGDGSSTAYGAWRPGSSRGCKMTQGGITAIPSWFANAYCSGRRLGLGFGGYFSAGNCGPDSLGPAFAAYAPPTGAAKTDIGSCTPLVGYPFPNHYARRIAGYTDNISHFGPWGDVGAWQWLDVIWGAGVWIDMPSKHGFLYMHSAGLGTISYHDSDIYGDGYTHCWGILDPSDLSLVAQGSKNQYDVSPSSYWEVHYPTYSYPLPNVQGAPYKTALGCTFDSTNNRLYVMFSDQASWQPTVAVYQVG